MSFLDLGERGREREKGGERRRGGMVGGCRGKIKMGKGRGKKDK